MYYLRWWKTKNHYIDLSKRSKTENICPSFWIKNGNLDIEKKIFFNFIKEISLKSYANISLI